MYEEVLNVKSKKKKGSKISAIQTFSHPHSLYAHLPGFFYYLDFWALFISLLRRIVTGNLDLHPIFRAPSSEPVIGGHVRGTTIEVRV